MPDGDLAPPRVDVVYYLRQRDHVGDRVKIGTTANPRQRLARISHQDLLAFERGDRRWSADATSSSRRRGTPARSGSA